MNTETKQIETAPVETAPEQSVADAVAAVDAKKADIAAGLVLTPEQSRIADANRANVKSAIGACDRATRGATQAIFAVLRQVTSIADADTVLTRLENDWRSENDNANIPNAWKTTKSPMLKAYRELPKLLEEALAAARVNMLKQSVLAEADQAEYLKTLRLDGDGFPRMQPTGFADSEHSLWKSAISGLKTAIAKSKETTGKTSTAVAGTVAGTVPNDENAHALPGEVKTVTLRFVRAVHAAMKDLPQPEVVAFIKRQAEELEDRITRKIGKADLGRVQQQRKAG